MTLMARWSGTCPECGGRWQPGDFIRADEDQAWKHAVCPDNLGDFDLKPTETVCQACWLVHPEGACDR